jgi:2-hydroxychromene-2-carboxylate isomerase
MRIMAENKLIEHFYAAHSAHAYLGAWELDRIAKSTGWTVQHRPFDLAPVMQVAGSTSFQQRRPEHITYFFRRELKRWTEYRNLPIMDGRPTYHDNPLGLPNCAIIAAGDDADALSRAILQAHWRDDADIADRNVLNGLADSVGLDGLALLATAASPAIADQHRANTNEAIQCDIFGSPTYFVRGDMFCGEDRLGMVERAIAQPFAD